MCGEQLISCVIGCERGMAIGYIALERTLFSSHPKHFESLENSELRAWLPRCSKVVFAFPSQKMPVAITIHPSYINRVSGS